MAQEQIKEILSALENPAVLGFLNRPAGGAGQGAMNSMGLFLVYDATGKLDIVNELRHERDTNSAEPVERTPLPVGDVTAEKVVSNGHASYDVQVGSYFIYTDTFAALEELVPRFAASHPPLSSFEQSPDIPSACRNGSQSSALDLFVLPSRFHAPATPSNPDFDIHAFTSSLHLDHIHAVCGRMSFDREVTRWHGVILGDTSQGSILDIFGDNRDSFATLPLAPSGSSFQCSVLNFAAFYNIFFNAITAALPSNKAAVVMGMTAFLSSTWGMPPDQAFGLFTGEFASIHPDPATDPGDTIYAITIHSPEKLLTILQHVYPGEQAAVKQDGDTTYLTVALPGSPVATSDPPAAPPAIYFALTPNMLVVSKQRDRVRDAVARLHSSPDSAAADLLSHNPDFLRARATLPPKLDGLSYANFASYNWQKVFADIEKSINEQVQAAAKREKVAPQPMDWVQGFDPSVISHYLHFSVGGAWKDSSGIYFDSYIQ
ncbi:MAG: hypothetical protein WBE20_13270 [Candidatus Acidiferrales bacterium]